MYYCRDHFWASSSESRHLRGSIRLLGIKNHGSQCCPGIDGGVEQNNIGFQFFYVVFIQYIIYYCHDHFWGPLSESRHLRGSMRHPVLKKHGFQRSPGIYGGVEQQKYWISVLFVWFSLVNYVLLPRSLLEPFKGVQTFSRQH